MALATAEALWALGDLAVDVYFSGEIVDSLLRAGGRYVVNKVKRKVAESAWDAVTGGTVNKPSDKGPVTTGGEASRRNGRLGGRPPWKHRGGLARFNSQSTARKRTYDEMEATSTTASEGEDNGANRAKRAAPANEQGYALTVEPTLLGSGGFRAPERHLVTKQLTFRHYLQKNLQQGWKYEAPSSEEGKTLYSEMVYTNKDWCYLPYTWFQMYMSSRDFQGLNVAYKRWKVVKFGVECSNIIPFVDDTKTVRGETTANVELAPINFFEAFTDVQGELPHYEVVGRDLPNNEGKDPYCARSKSSLLPVTLIYNGYSGKEGDTLFALEQSPGYQFVAADQGFQFYHDVHPVDQQWRHAMFPINANYQFYKNNYTQNDQWMAPIMGRRNCQSSLLYAKNYNSNKSVLPGVIGDNLLYDSWTGHFPHSPPPTILFRVPRVDLVNDKAVPYGFVLYCTYKIVIEAEPNYTTMNPVTFSAPTPGKLFYGERESFQATGGDQHGMMRVGNKKGGYANIDVSVNDIN